MYQVVFVTPKRRVNQGRPVFHLSWAVHEANELYDSLKVPADAWADFVVIDNTNGRRVYSARQGLAEYEQGLAEEAKVSRCGF